MFVDSTSAISRVGDDTLGPGQHFAVAATEVCSRILARDNDVTIRWAPAYSGATANEVTDRYAKSAATGDAPVEEIPEGYAEEIPERYTDETSLSHMTRVVTQVRSHEAAEWISRHVRPERRYRPPSGRGLRRPQPRQVRKTLAGRYCQLLSGHAATGAHRLRFGMTDTSECWWCAGGEPQSRHHLFTRCRVWAPQAKKMWKAIGKACEWKRPRTPSVGLLWDGRATEAVLEFLRTTRVGCIGTERVPPEEEEGEDSEGEEGGPGPP